MKNLVILVKMQLKEQLDFKRLDVKSVNWFKILLSVLWVACRFVAVVVLSGAFLTVTRNMNLFSGANRIPDTVMSIIFYFMIATAMISCMIGLTKSIYYARDNAVLLTLPCSALQVYLSKLFIFFVFEMKRNLSFLVPLFIAYYWLHGYPFGVYLWMLVCMVAVSLFTVAIGAILSVPAMWVSTFMRRHRSVQISSIATCVTAMFILVFTAISFIPANIDLRDNWRNTSNFIRTVIIKGFQDNFGPLYKLSLVFFGETDLLLHTSFNIGATALRFGIILASAIILTIVGILIVCPLFYKMASTPFEYLKGKVKPKKNKRHSRRLSMYYNEFAITLKTTNRMIANIGVLVSTPLLVFLLNKVFHAMNTREIGDNMVIAFNVLIVLLIILNFNCQMASIFSRDGRSNYLIKTHPAKYILAISAKLLPNTVFVFVSLILTGVIIGFTTSVSFINTLLLMLSVTLIYLSHMLFSAELDLMNPQIELYATVGQSDSNPNETTSTATAFVLAFLTAGACMYLLSDKTGMSMYPKLLLVAVIAFIWRIRSFLSKIAVYYKEK